MKLQKGICACVMIATILLTSIMGYAKEIDVKEDTKLTKENAVISLNEDQTKEIDTKIEKKLKSMTLEQKIYQMFIVTPESITGQDTVTSVGPELRQQLEQYPVGGIVYFTKNLESPSQTKAMVNIFTNYGYLTEQLPLFQCIDEEGGRVARVGKKEAFHVDQIGPMGDVDSKEEAYQDGAYIGSYLYELGFNFDFAPDADVITNPQNKVIGDRSFGTDAEQVTEYATAVSDGLHSQNVMSAFKHFPGHGATEGDTHEGFAYTSKSYEQLTQSELVPFAYAGEAEVDAVMVSHIAVPAITGDNTPCTLSRQMITDVLRGDLQYDGLIITDAMNMGAITKLYSADEAAVMAIQAGADIVLMPEDFVLAVQGVQQAVQNGKISEEQIDESVTRILKAKNQINE